MKKDLTDANKAEKLEVVVEDEFTPRHQEAFNDFVSWLALPTMLRKPPKLKGERMAVETFLENMAIDDPSIVELAMIPTHTAFAEKYGVAKETLSRWTKEIHARDLLIEARSWAALLVSNALFALYNKIIQGKASGYETSLYFQVATGWSPKLRLDLNQSRTTHFIFEVVDPNQLLPEEDSVILEEIEQAPATHAKPVYRLNRPANTTTSAAS